MKKYKLQILYIYCLLLSPLICGASDFNLNSTSQDISKHTLKRDYPDAPKRTFIQNYKDMVFASCLTKAYNDNKDIVKDIGSSEGALQQWVSYDINESVDEEFKIVNSYLSRNYFNPIVEAQIKGVKFDFLKCLDLYHSKELDKLARKVISYPQRKASQGY